MNRLSDRGSIPLSSITEKLLKSSVLAVFLCPKLSNFAVSDRLKPFETGKNVVKLWSKMWSKLWLTNVHH